MRPGLDPTQLFSEYCFRCRSLPSLWCKCLEACGGVGPPLDAGDLQCVFTHLDALINAGCVIGQ